MTSDTFWSKYCQRRTMPNCLAKCANKLCNIEHKKVPSALRLNQGGEHSIRVAVALRDFPAPHRLVAIIA
jgi:hypothetical protein